MGASSRISSTCKALAVELFLWQSLAGLKTVLSMFVYNMYVNMYVFKHVCMYEAMNYFNPVLYQQWHMLCYLQHQLKQVIERGIVVNEYGYQLICKWS